jgi:opacity protein-like surface antigen
MRTLAILGVLAATTIHPALASDLKIPPLYKAPPVTAPPVWTGFYLGGHVGAGWAGGGDLRFSASGLGDINPIVLGGSRSAGFVGGGHGGYIRQLTPNWVFGIEGDISGTDIGSSSTATITGSVPAPAASPAPLAPAPLAPAPAAPAPSAGGKKHDKPGKHGYDDDCDPPAPAAAAPAAPAPAAAAPAAAAPAAPTTMALPAGSRLNMSRDLNWLASMRGRVGYTWDRTLFYVTGGIAWGNFGYAASAAFGPSASASFNDTKTGWVIGGGAEWAFAPSWSLRAEYLHYEFAGTSRTVPTAGGTISFGWQDTSVDVVRTGVTYRFGELTQMARR